ncbi:MAG: hypothetical protein VB128_14875 [Sedimentibacter saalensis]|jgi:hypothetical protein|uniref:hypothetical protein n=1 Tax=Sedimentibacter saalensis TaxID=130788 RepID=UPI002B2129D3|nr:hypothetical protein [Sedimentibacter saalensis]MEA5096235.1 hypothetical protein [Sedimentibacter saalensis]
MNENANQNKELEELEVEFDFEAMKGYLSKQLEDSFSDLSLLEEDRKNIANPESLGKTILDEVWKQFGNQIGLDVTNETLIQQYDREHPEQYKDIADVVMKDQAYIDVNKAMKEQQQAGQLKDEYTGKDLKRNDKANLDHVVPRKELFENQRRKQANLGVAELANKDENLKATNESLNKAKGAKTNDEYLDYIAKNAEEIKAKAEKKKTTIEHDDSKYDIDKKAGIEKIDKSVEDRLSADPDRMKQADKTARKAINKDIATGAVKEVGKKAGKDALKTATISALFSLLKEIMNGFVRFLKLQSKTFSKFLAEMKAAIKSFFSKIMSVVQTGVSALVGTIVSEIFGPIVSIFKKLASFIKQGVSSFIDAINYLKDKSNKDKPFSVKVAQVGKIVTAGLTVGSAVVLGEVFEKFLLTVPGMQITLPLLGTLANLIGLFLGSLVSGLVGAIVMNLIDRFIAKKIRSETTKDIIEKQNDIVNIQQLQKFVAENKVEKTKAKVSSEIRGRHEFVKEHIITATEMLFENSDSSITDDGIIITENNNDFSQMQKDLEELL